MNGDRGRIAHDLVAAEYKLVLARAPAPSMEEKIALVVETRPDLVEPTLVQVSCSGSPFLYYFLYIYLFDTCEMFVASLTRRFVSAKRLFRDL